MAMTSSPSKLKSFWLALLLAVVLIVLDQISKQAVVASLALHEAVPYTNFFSLVNVRNYGAAFGFLNNAGGWQTVFFSAVAVIASVVIIRWLWQIAGTQRQLSLGLVLILSGALGNLIDRIAFGYVIDFLSFHYGDWAFPAFNIADMAISAGAILLLCDAFGWHFIRDHAETETA